MSAHQGAGSGMTLVETMQACIDATMDVADGVSVWFGGRTTGELGEMVDWFQQNYGS